MTARTVLRALLAALALLDGLILVVRFASVLSAADVTVFTAEGPVLYAIWKIRHGYPLYEWPLTAPFTVTYYNPVFYEIYARVFSLFGVRDAATPLAGRVITLAWLLGAVAMQYVATRRLLRPVNPSRTLPALMAAITWTGAVFPGWWAMAIRPDIAAVTCALCGVYLSMRAFEGSGRARSLLAAGAAFAAAWTIKQSYVAFLAGTLVYIAMWRRSFRELAAAVAPFAATATAALALGGSAYRANVLLAPSVNPLSMRNVLAWFRGSFFADALLWAVLIVVVVRLIPSWLASVRSPYAASSRSRQLLGVDATYVALLVACAFVIDSILLSKSGAALNTLFELHAALALLTAAALNHLMQDPSPSRAVARAAAAALIVMGGSSAARVLRERVTIVPALEHRDAAAGRLRQLTAIVAVLPRPVYAEDDLLALPWIATGNQYPAIIRDGAFHERAQELGLLGPGIEGMIRTRRFASVIVPSGSPRAAIARDAGYSAADVAVASETGLTIFRRSP
jgi:hypothetical protein